MDGNRREFALESERKINSKPFVARKNLQKFFLLCSGLKTKTSFNKLVVKKSSKKKCGPFLRKTRRSR